MNYPKKSRKLLFVATTLTIIALASVLTVYAVSIGTFSGGEVTVGGASGSVKYSAQTSDETAGLWTSTLTPATESSSWYSRVEIAYSGTVTISWQLQYKTGPSTWTDVGSSISTSIALTGGNQNVYATATGVLSGNHDWSSDVTVAGTYRVTATVVSA